MTPQQLIDMPGAGNAEKWLRKNGKWRLNAIDQLRQALITAQDTISDMQLAVDDAIIAYDKLTKEATNCN